MNKQDLIKIVSQNMKLLRAEYNYSQQAMANTIGLSKKTYIQIEKERLLLSWTATCASCAVFRNSKLLGMALGEDPASLVETLAHEDCYTYEDIDNRNYLFWDVILENSDYSIQKNVITERYKIVDKNGKNVFSSFSLDKVNAVYNDYLLKGDK